MKKFYSLFLALMTAGLLSTVYAAEKTYTVNIDHADRITLKVNYRDQEIHDGDNTFTVDPGDYSVSVIAEPKSGYVIESVVNSAGTPTNPSGTSYYFYFDNNDANLSYTVKTATLEELRTSTFTLTIDKPEEVCLTTKGTYQTLPLVAGEQQIAFMPSESPLSLTPLTYGTEIYCVTLNGETLTSSYGSYSLDVKDGDKVDVQVAFPDKDLNVTLTEKGDEGFVTSVTVDGTPVENFKSFTAKAGSKIQIYGDTEKYSFSGMTVNDLTVSYFYGSYPFVLKEDTNIEVEATKLATFTISLTIDDPENVIVYRGYSDTDRIDLVAGENTIEFTVSPYGVSFGIKASDKGVLKQVLRNDVDVTGSYSYSAEPGDVYVVTTEKLVRDKHAVLFIDGLANVPYLSLTRGVETSTRSTVEVKEGYNLIDFLDSENPFGLGFYTGNEFGSVYVDGQKAEPMFEGSQSYYLTLTDGGVVKTYLGAVPDVCTLTLDIAPEAAGYTLVQNTITDITGAASAEDFAGTCFEVTVPEGVEATLDDEALTLDNGVATFTLTKNSTLKLATPTGVENVVVKDSKLGGVYNLQGVRVATDADAVKNLPAGIYVIGGKKVYVK